MLRLCENVLYLLSCILILLLIEYECINNIHIMAVGDRLLISMVVIFSDYPEKFENSHMDDLFAILPTSSITDNK